MTRHNMASARKKSDERNIKILRELVALSENKYCFDCHQRGPTYVNVTIGSFVCTSCSGMLRGLTPPHRVKSISMATFTSEEIEQLKTQGNEYCRKVWLGLYENSDSTFPPKDEQQIKEFMINKYERKRYYLKPEENGNISMNGLSKQSTNATNYSKSTPSVTIPTIPSYNRLTNNNCHDSRSTSVFLSENFTSNKEINSSVDNFNSSNLNGDVSHSSVSNFANFDNNPIFNSSTSNTLQGAVSSNESGAPPPPSEDRYAALKDLDCLMKSQLLSSTPPCENITTENDKINKWGENNVVWPTSVFEQPQNPSEVEEIPKTLNPFSGSEDGWNNAFTGNPFKTENVWLSNNCHTNGLAASQSMNYISSRSVWGTNQFGNPFYVNNNGPNITHHSSNNPFL